ncbi:putative Rho GTPase-activating protein [Iris pallida]|uniref:Rho GTPase-activating protein n=2 Tax=Iris pallida TaxID=29817 RepID=A0AAX6H840_IRIPA|nr:putative Rho GTPase-activating protein [Iris pallida]
MPPELSPRWRAKANDFFSTSGVKLKQAGQSAGENVADVAEKVGSVVKSRWALFREARERRAAGPPGEPLQERFLSAVATTGLLLRKGVSETKEKVVVGKMKVEEAAKKTADKSKIILTNIERWQKGVATNDVFGVPLEVTVQRQHITRLVPQVLVRCADHLIISGLNSEYLFKVEGDRKVIRQLISLYNQDWNASLPDGVNPVEVAALIKCYLASLPEPLTTFGLYHNIREARSSIPDMRNILKKLPNANYMTLEFVTALFLRVSQKSSVNKMDASSLAVELAPVVMRQKGDLRADFCSHLYYTSRGPSKTPGSASNYNANDLLFDEDDSYNAASQIPLDDGSPPDYGAIEVIQCLIEHHNAIFTDANETIWR